VSADFWEFLAHSTDQMSDSAAPSSDPAGGGKPRALRRLPLSLRIFVILLSLLCVVSVLWIGVPAYRRDAAIQQIERVGGSVGSEPRVPEWLRPIVGRRFTNATGVVKLALFRGPGITEGDLKCLNQLPDVTQLFIFGVNITEGGLEIVISLQNCDYLDLGGSTVDDRGLERITQMKQLRVLFLPGAKVTDSGLAHLRELRCLEYLDLQETSITDAGLNAINSIATLKTLDVSNTNVTDHGIHELQRARPSLSIIR
jgi:hypothetical protein